jgi:hypothetical protein
MSISLEGTKLSELLRKHGLDREALRKDCLDNKLPRNLHQ